MSHKNVKTSRPPVGRSRLFAVLALAVGVLVTTAYAQPSASLERELVNAGWSTQREADGSLTLRPPPQRPASATTAEPATHTPDSETLKGRLRDRGWGVEQESDGTLVLHPPSVPTAPEPTAGADPGAAEQGISPNGDLANALRARNWRVETLADGSLVVRRPVSAEPAQSPLGFDPGCAPWTAPAVANGDVQLPVDQWSEAYRIASQWVDEQAPQGVQVGRIRQVPRLYVVSIVADRKPFTLMHQLVVRKRDGRVSFIH